MDVRCLVVPYDSGQRHARMGRGPDKLLEGAGWLRQQGTLEIERIEAADSFPEEIAGTFALLRLLAERVRATVAARHFPLVLAGNCFAAVGVLAGLSSVTTSVFWFDCHGDFNTPETTSSGFLDGMGLATASRHRGNRCGCAPPWHWPGSRPRLGDAGALDGRRLHPHRPGRARPE
jgi:arginase